MIYFLSQLSLMMEVGTSIPQALRAMEVQTASPRLRQAIRDLMRAVDQGRSLSDAMSEHPRVFDGILVSMVRAGETGGYLKECLERMVEMREKREAVISQMRAALSYPIILCVMCTGVIIFILTGVLPKFTAFFAGKEALLPASTRFLMAASHSLRGFWWAYLVGLAAAILGGRLFLAAERGRWLVDRVTLGLPLLGKVVNKIQTSQLLRMLGHLLESKVAVLDALEVTRRTIGNRYYAKLVDEVGKTVQRGGRLATAFSTFSFMPPSVRQMISTGEESGNLYPVMLRLAKHYDVEIEQDLKRLASMIEPIALVILGSVVGFIVASVILPMFKLARAIQ